MRKRERAFVATIQCITFSCGFCYYKVQFFWCTSQTHFIACEGVISKRYFFERNYSSPCNLLYDIQLMQWSGCFRKVNIYMTYYIKQPRITQEVRVIVKGQPYVTHKVILSFQIVSCSLQVVSGRFLLVVGRFRSLRVLVSTKKKTQKNKIPSLPGSF